MLTEAEKVLAASSDFIAHNGVALWGLRERG